MANNNGDNLFVDDDEVIFADGDIAPTTSNNSWKIMLVDDEEEIRCAISCNPRYGTGLVGLYPRGTAP